MSVIAAIHCCLLSPAGARADPVAGQWSHSVNPHSGTHQCDSLRCDCRLLCRLLSLNTAGAQAEPVPGQWSYSLGPCIGIHFADQLWMSRFILLRLSEHFQLVASLDPKPVRTQKAAIQKRNIAALLLCESPFCCGCRSTRPQACESATRFHVLAGGVACCIIVGNASHSRLLHDDPQPPAQPHLLLDFGFMLPHCDSSDIALLQVPGAWAGSGAPISFSTRDTREPGKGWYAVQAHVRALAGAHMRHMMVYGAGNDRRLTGRDK